MRYLALASDYDGTLAHHGRVTETTLAALERLRASGRKLVLVTGRELDDLFRVFPQADLFDRIVAENGGVLYDPGTRESIPLAEAPDSALVHALEQRGVTPLSVGRVIVATWEPHGATVFEAIRDLGLELHVAFNKGAVMVLPSGVNKATGLRRALDALKLSPHNTVAVGDAENDHAFLAACECGVAVANALESVKSHVDFVTARDHGAGVEELIDMMIGSDLAELVPRQGRHELVLGLDEAGNEIRLAPFGHVVLVAGPSGAGKTTVTTAWLEALCNSGRQFCVVDPEGDYHEFPEGIALRGDDPRALADEAFSVLDRPWENVIVSLLDLGLEERPAFVQILLPRLVELRASTARPAWIVIDEAHHLLPATWQPSDAVLHPSLTNALLVTIHPDHVASAALRLVDTLIVVGRDAQSTINAFAQGRGEEPIALADASTEDGFAWFLRLGSPPVRFRPREPQADRRRHQRKYATGELGEDRSFYFRGPDGRLNLRAQNLELFTQLANGVDDETWEYHLRRQDISRWFRLAIKDESLAAEAAEIEARDDLSPGDSRARVQEAIRRRYTTPA